MRSPRAAVTLLALLLAGFLLWLATHLGPDALPPAGDNARPPPASQVLVATRGLGDAATTPPERSPLADALNAPNTDIQADLRLVAGIIETFRSNFLQTGNPTGTNAEIMTALTGRNRIRLVLIPPEHPAINREGELCDRWGTPFFFHAESATRMEIRSAGPDRRMWNEDDVLLSR